MENHSRQERELRTYRLLDRLNIPYKRIDHAPAMTMEDCLAVDQALDVKMCKNLFLCNRQQTAFYLLMMPGDKKFPHQGSFLPAGLRPAVLCRRALSVGISGHPSRLRQHHGSDE